MNNKQIRAQAKYIFRQNSKRLCLLFLLACIPTCVYPIAASLFGLTEPLKALLSFCFSISIYPFSLGVTSIFGDAFHGRQISIDRLFRFYNPLKLLVPALTLGAVTKVLSYACNHFTAFLRSLPLPSPLLLLAPLIVLTAYGILLLCFFLAPYCYIQNPGQGALRIIKESLQKTKGYILDILAFEISIFWPLFFLLPVVLVIFSVFATFSGVLSLSTSLSVSLFMPFTYFLLFPLFIYTNLCIAGFAAELLAPRSKRKIKKPLKKPSQKYQYKTNWFNSD